MRYILPLVAQPTARVMNTWMEPRGEGEKHARHGRFLVPVLRFRRHGKNPECYRIIVAGVGWTSSEALIAWPVLDQGVSLVKHHGASSPPPFRTNNLVASLFGDEAAYQVRGGILVERTTACFLDDVGPMRSRPHLCDDCDYY